MKFRDLIPLCSSRCDLPFPHPTKAAGEKTGSSFPTINFTEKAREK